MKFSALILAATVAFAAGAASAQKQTLPGEILGKVELAPGVPCASCTVLVEGSPLGARTDASGIFRISRLPPGSWDLRVNGKDLPDPHFRIAAASNAGTSTDIGVLRPWKPGNISGRVELPGGYMMADTVVEMPIQGLAVKPGADGTFLLQNVAPGNREIVVNTAQRRLHKKAIVAVQPGQTARVTVKIDDPAATVVKPKSSVPIDRVDKVPAQTPVKPVR